MKKFFLPLFLLLLVAATHANEKLIFALDLIRHGDRTPSIEIIPHSTLWPEGVGQLTSLGMRQEFLLGKRKRKDYVARYKLLDDTYKFNTLQVRSSNFSRTLMSAQSFLLGMFPLGFGPKVKGAFALPSGFQPVPIHTLPKEKDYLLIPHEESEGFASILADNVYSKEEWQAKEKLFHPYFKKWSNLFHHAITHINELASIGDNLYIRQLKKIPFPKGLSNEDGQKIITLSRWMWVKQYQDHEVAVFAAKPLLRKIQFLIKNAVGVKTPLKYQLYSAHDSTIMALLSALKVAPNEIPPYASDVNILLFKNNAAYTIKITYNEKPVNLRGCHKGYCDLSVFNSLIEYN